MRGAILIVGALGCASGKLAGDVDASGPDMSCDGLPCDVIYVATSGSDTAEGTKEAPLKTITAAITRAEAAVPKRSVLVRRGMYAEQIAMAAGVGIYGGFDDSWRRDRTSITEIVGASPAVTFESIKAPTVLDRLTVRSRDATAAGESSYAITVRSSQGVELRDVVVVVGIGAAGTDGADGAAGAPDGANGIGGQPGCEDSGIGCSSCNQPLGGAGGFSFCGRTGGRGGNAGHDSNGGGAGTAGLNGTSAGAVRIQPA